MQLFTHGVSPEVVKLVINSRHAGSGFSCIYWYLRKEATCMHISKLLQSRTCIRNLEKTINYIWHKLPSLQELIVSLYPETKFRKLPHLTFRNVISPFLLQLITDLFFLTFVQILRIIVYTNINSR